MNILVAYASKTGATARCAQALAAKLPQATLCDLSKNQPNLNDFSVVIIGGSIRLGSLNKAAKNFIFANQQILSQKKAAYFICNAFLDQAQDIIQNNLPQSLLTKAICVDSFGGEMDPQKQRGLERWITKAVSKKGVPGCCILPERIESFANKILQQLT